MPNVNHVFIAGNLTRAPELRYTPGGKAVANFSVAINRKWRSKDDGKEGQEVTFVDVTAWGKQAEACAQNLQKGAAVAVDGRLRQEVWETKETKERRSRLVVVAQRVDFITRAPKAKGSEKPAPPAVGAPPADAPPADAPPADARRPSDVPHVEDGVGPDDDIPF